MLQYDLSGLTLLTFSHLICVCLNTSNDSDNRKNLNSRLLNAKSNKVTNYFLTRSYGLKYLLSNIYMWLGKVEFPALKRNQNRLSVLNHAADQNKAFLGLSEKDCSPQEFAKNICYTTQLEISRIFY